MGNRGTVLSAAGGHKISTFGPPGDPNYAGPQLRPESLAPAVSQMTPAHVS